MVVADQVTEESVTPQEAAVLFARALGYVAWVQPEELQEPLRELFAAGVAGCVGARSMAGRGQQELLNVASALVDAQPNLREVESRTAKAAVPDEPAPFGRR